MKTEDDAVDFLKRVKFALRYNSTPSLPLASMYGEARDQRIAIELTNVLLAREEAIETNLIADRLVLVHRDVFPVLYALRVRLRTARLSDYAEKAFQLIREDGTASAGDVRRFLGVDGMKRPDPADIALGDLQREVLIDRGPSSVPRKGIPYLSKEGFPYRIFEKAHPEIVKKGKKLSPEDALEKLRGFTAGIPARKVASIFKLCLTPAERLQWTAR
jgi:hypothetical protein